MASQGNLFHPNESERIETLHEMQILDTPIEQRFEQVTVLMRSIFDVPISALSFVDLHRQWFKSIQGQRIEQTRRCISFCQHTILQNEVMVIPDARFDDRFANSPLVTEGDGVVFYAGAPVYGPTGLPVASLCILDRQPRSLDEREKMILTQFARLVETLLQSPRASHVEDLLINQIGESWRSTLIDPLTRVWNADGIKTLISETVARSKTSFDHIGISMIELTGVKEITKAYGPAAADEITLEFSRRVLEVIKPHDSIGHLRGSEFCVLNIKLQDQDMLYDRLGMLQMVADELNNIVQSENNKVGARVCSIFLDPRSTTSAQSAMLAVEESITNMPRGVCLAPMIINDPGSQGHCSAA